MKQASTSLFAKTRCWKSRRVYAGILAAYCLAGPEQVQAQDYFIKDDFRTNSTDNFRVGGNASLTSTISTGDGGYLRLTSAATNQKGFAISKQTFNPVNGFSISFEYFSYGGASNNDSQRAKADGISLFLIDGTIVADPNNFVPGGYGGSLGYAQLVEGNTNLPGATGGYIGIGLDEFGGYSAAIEGKNGGPGRVVSGVAIRGAGNGTTSATAYPYITGRATGTYTVSGTTRTLTSGFGIDVATVRAQSASADYRRVFVDVFPTSKGATTYKVTVRIQNGSVVSTVIDNQVVTASSFGTQVMPNSLRIGFAASTGGSTNFHEVRDLQIVRPPVANNDVVFTSYNTAVTFSPLTNDEASGSSLDVATLDLDPTTVAIDNTLTVPQGTFAIGSNGAVTFTPSGSFSGSFTVPYTVQSILKSISNQGIITINVTGADIATVLNGPTAVNVGSSVTYTTTTSNVGIEAGSNVVPKLVLTGDVTVTQRPANATITSTGTGATKVTTITFPAIASLSPSDTPVENPVTFTLNSGDVTGVSSFTTAVPDPSIANNTATLATGGYNLTDNANGCGGPGKDGPGPVGVAASDGTGTIINTYFRGQTSAVAGAKSITLAGSGTGYDTPIMPGDLVLIMQMQGATINSTNTSSYGALSNVTAGIYEYAVAAPNTNVSYAGGGTLVLMKGLANAYTAVAATSSAGPQRFQVIRIPQYSSYNAANAVSTTGLAWNGATGGVLVLDVVGVTTFANAPTAFNMTGKGFRGGGGVRFAGIATGYSSNDYVNVAADRGLAGAHGSKGEGIVGTPRYVRQSNSAFIDLGQDTYPGGSVGRGAPGNAGGGGTDAAVATNTGNTGGGGGSNAINTDNGGSGGNYNTATVGGGLGAIAPGLSAGTRLFMGGGGGAGSSSSTLGAENGNGANGGGIIILRTGTVAGTGIMNVRGSSGGSTTANGAGGGGGGGSVLITSSNSLANITINADGGSGGSTTSATAVSPLLGAGGGGSGGVVYYDAPTSPPTARTGGGAGTAKATAAGTATTNGAGPGISGPETQVTATGIYATVACRPDLDVFLRTNTPQVVRGEAMQATYTLTVVNDGGAATDVRAVVTLANGTNATTGGSATGTANGLFKYKSTSAATITLADKTVVPLTTTAGALNSYTAPDAAASTPVFSGIDLPAGAVLTITFQVDMATTVANTTPYQSGAQVSYLDPTRSTASRMISPGDTYEGAATAAPGVNYVSTSSTGEDVSTARPLPVELKQFSALAIRQDVGLTWVTASEKNSDRFEVERSWDGKHFEVVGTVKGQGYSSQEHSYRFTDENAALQATALVAYYRLHQIDADGTASYSSVKTVRFEKSLQTAVRMYPNPAQGQVTLDLMAVPAGSYQVQVVDMTGRVLTQHVLAGQQRHELSIGELTSGSYLVRVTGASVNMALRLLHN